MGARGCERGGLCWSCTCPTKKHFFKHYQLYFSLQSSAPHEGWLCGVGVGQGEWVMGMTTPPFPTAAHRPVLANKQPAGDGGGCRGPARTHAPAVPW